MEEREIWMDRERWRLLSKTRTSSKGGGGKTRGVAREKSRNKSRKSGGGGGGGVRGGVQEEMEQE